MKLTYSNVMSTIAVFGVLAGGGAYAQSKIGSGDIRKNAVKAKHIAKNAVRGKQVDERKLNANRLRTRVAQGACQPAVPGTGPMVKVGSTCIDRYESSLWTQPDGGEQITGAIPCETDGTGCRDKIFARAVAGAIPRADISWFQAQQALASSGKRLPTSAEWQAAAAGTPGAAPCVVDAFASAAAGEAAGCVSDWGANDMVGNVAEWVAEWTPQSSCEGSWPDRDDLQLMCGAATSGPPGALYRGGGHNWGPAAGALAVSAAVSPLQTTGVIGFRGAR